MEVLKCIFFKNVICDWVFSAQELKNKLKEKKSVVANAWDVKKWLSSAKGTDLAVYW